ncbi:hypothetical protein GCM10009661_26690 [Catellatospora chokoriensis]|uniref:RHS repeat-associated protein n=1 Tax=Catellatospora chokoriensis TaxID=310353 RepID=A0A8J3K387_9ACTN|nr:hypothetical protein Cch02nite_11280 [Catellatospora chokoriensis]
MPFFRSTRNRHRSSTRSLAQALALVLVATSSAFVAQAAVPAAAQEPAEASVLDRPDRGAALATARVTGRKVRVTSLTSETTEVFANPDGSVTVEQASAPERALDAKGRWTGIDLTLTRGSDGWIRPALSAADVRFSGGGTGPLVELVRQGKSMTLSWPKPLAAPSLQGEGATYAEVLPGVDLVLRATRTGFTHVLVVKSARAAANPALRKITFGLGGSMAVSRHADGTLRATAGGRALAWTESVTMWDSSIAMSAVPDMLNASGRVVGETVVKPGARRSTAAGPGDGARSAAVQTQVAGGDLVLAPALNLLGGASAQYPVFIDPPWSVFSSKWAYATNNNESNNSDNARVGYNDATGGVYRSYFEFPTSTLIGKKVTAASVEFSLDHSWSCGNTPTTMFSTPAINATPKATWSTMTASNVYLATASSHANETGGCGVADQGDAKPKFTSTALINTLQSGADTSKNTITLGLCACDSNGSSNETVQDRWKRFYTSGHKLSVTYTAKPVVAARTTTPNTSCVVGSGRPLIASATPTLSAQITDDESATVSATFEWWALAGSAAIRTVTVSDDSGAYLETAVPAGDLVDGSTYKWRVKGNDGVVDSAWSSWCEFTVDSTKPAQPTVTSTSHPVTSAWYSATTFLATVASSDTNGVAGYAVVYDQTSSTNPGTTVTQTGTALSRTGLADGIYFAHVTAVDQAGNWSAAKHFQFKVDATKPGTPVGLISTTHPLATATYPSHNVTISWSAPSDLSTVNKYAVKVDQSATTVPATTDNPVTTPTFGTTLTGDGTWWLHVRARDTSGNWSDVAAHIKVNVDTVVPTPVITSSSHPDQNAAYPTGSVSASWTATGSPTGYSVVVDQTATTTPDTTVDQTAATYTGTLADGTWYLHVRAQSAGGTWGATAHYEIRIDTATPVAPAVSSTDYPAGQWAKTPNQLGVVNIAPGASTDVTTFVYTFDGGPQSFLVATPGNPVSLNVIPTADGPHTLVVQAKDAAGNTSAATTYTFFVGDGAGTVTGPLDGDISAAKTILRTTGHASTTGVTYEWRRADTDTWTAVPTAHVTYTAGGGAVTWPVATTGSGAYPALNWDITATLSAVDAQSIPRDGPLQVRAVFSGTGFGPSPQIRFTFDRDRAQGTSQEVGPGMVNLLTGDYTVGGGDVAVGSLFLGRSLRTRQSGGTDPLFGPGWTSSVLASEANAPYTKLTAFGSLLQVALPDGTVRGFTAVGDGTGFVPQAGVNDTDITYSASQDKYTLVDVEDNTVVFQRAAGDPAGEYHPVKVTNANSGDSTTLSWEKVTVGGVDVVRPTRALAPVPTGVSCATLVRGCQALTFAYATATTATGTADGQWGNYTGRVSEVSFTAWDPDLAAMRTVATARYSYDSNGRLRAAWDPRLDWTDEATHSLRTVYTYDGDGVLSSVAPPALEPWTFSYTVLPGDSGKGRLASVSRTALSAGTNTTTVVYRVPTSGAGAPYDLSPGQTARWAQTVAPTDATAIYPGTQVPNGDQATGTLPSSYERAVIAYLDANARTVNSAAPGGGLTATWFDQFGNVEREITAKNRQRALDESATDGVANESTRAKSLSTQTKYSVDGRRAAFSVGPEHRVTLNDGRSVRGRIYTDYIYDEGASNGPYDLVTTEKSSISWWDTGAQRFSDERTVKTAYDWSLQLPTSTTVDPLGLNLQSRVAYDSKGRVISETAPGGGSSDTTPSTRVSVYYTAAANSTWPQCGGHPEWDGLLCLTHAGGQPAAGAELPRKVLTYGFLGQARTMSEITSAGTLRTTTITYDQAGRTYETGVSAPGLGEPIDRIRYVYDPATAQLVASQTVNATNTVTAEILRSFDSLGRPTSYTDASANTSTTTYDLLSRPIVVDDGKATRTYAYDEGTERRGLPTSVTDSEVGRFTAKFDVEGAITKQVWPNGVELSAKYNELNNGVSLTYTQPGCGEADCTLYTDALTMDSADRWRSRTSTLTARTYAYDEAGRLASAVDVSGGQCETRSYSYDAASNQTGRVVYGPGVDGICQTTTASASRSWSVDEADRVTTGYTYDALGRSLTVPGGDTAVPGGGDLTVSYHANDMVKSVAQGTRTASYVLDVVPHRFRSWTDDVTGTAVTKVNHYLGDNDVPSWTDEGGGNHTRVISGVAGVVGGHTATAGEVWVLANLHGDFIAAMPETGFGLASTREYTESGEVRLDPTADPSAADGMLGRYGWLGAELRNTENPGGVMLMGARLYTPGSGRFLSTDPIYGGSCNAYEYSCGDGVNYSDPTGFAMTPGGGGGSGASVSCSKTASYRKLTIFPPSFNAWVDIKCTFSNFTVKLLLNGAIAGAALIAVAGAASAGIICLTACLTGVGALAAIAVTLVSAAQSAAIIAVVTTIKDVYADRCKPNGYWFKFRITAKLPTIGRPTKLSNFSHGCVTRA